MIEPHVNHTFTLVNDSLIPSDIFEEQQHSVQFRFARVVISCILSGLTILLIALLAHIDQYHLFFGWFVAVSGFFYLLSGRGVRIEISRNDGSLIITGKVKKRIKAKYNRETYRFKTERLLFGRNTTSWYYVAEVVLPNGKFKTFPLLGFHGEDDRDTVNAYAARMSVAIENCLHGNSYDNDLIVNAREKN